MNLGERIIITIYTFCIAVASLFVALLPFGINVDMFGFFADDARGNLIITLVALVFFIISIVLLLSGIKGNKKRSVLKLTNLGEVRVSFNAIEGLALKTVKQIPGIRDTKLTVDMDKEQILIGVRTLVMADTNIPETIVQIQNLVKEYIEKYTGIMVKEVRVDVTGVWESSKLRVE